MKHFVSIFLIIGVFLSAKAAQHLNSEPAGRAFVKISAPSCPLGRKSLGKIDSGQVICDGELRVQLGAFKDLSNAKNFVAKMRAQGIDASIDPGVDGQVNRVFFSIGGGISFSEDSSKIIAAKLARDGVKYSMLSRQQGSVSQSAAQSQPPVAGSEVDNSKLLLSLRNLPEIKISLAQCAGQYTYAVALMHSGVLKYPNQQSHIASLSSASQMSLRFANRISGEDSDKVAEDFYKKLHARHKVIVSQYGEGAKAQELSFSLVQDGVAKCGEYLGNPRLVEQLRQGQQQGSGR